MAKRNQNTTVSTIVETFAEFVRAQVATSEEKRKVDEQFEGAYAKAVRAAALAKGKPSVFAEGTDKVFEAIRTNEGGIAESLGCKLAKVQDGDKPIYVVPKQCSVARSVLNKALTLNVDVGTAQKPRPYTQIRKEATYLWNQKRATEDPVVADLDRLAAAYDALRRGARKVEPQQFHEAVNAIQSIAEQIGEMASANKRTEAKVSEKVKERKAAQAEKRAGKTKAKAKATATREAA